MTRCRISTPGHWWWKIGIVALLPFYACVWGPISQWWRQKALDREHLAYLASKCPECHVFHGAAPCDTVRTNRVRL